MATLDADDLLALGQTAYTASSAATLTANSSNQIIRASTIQNTASHPALLLDSGYSTTFAKFIRSFADNSVEFAGGNHSVYADRISGFYAVTTSGTSGGRLFLSAKEIGPVEDIGFGPGQYIAFTSESHAGQVKDVVVNCEHIFTQQLLNLAGAVRLDITANTILTSPATVTLNQAGSSVVIRNARIDSNVTCSAGTLTLIDCVIDGNLTQSGTGVVRMTAGTQVVGTVTGTVTRWLAGLDAIAAKTGLIGTVSAFTPSPLAGTQLTIVQSDDYVVANGRAIVFTVTTPVTPASTQIGIQGLSPITGAAVDNGDTLTLTFELDAATTAQLTTCGLLDYTVQITDGSGNEFTVVSGRVRVLRKYT